MSSAYLEVLVSFSLNIEVAPALIDFGRSPLLLEQRASTAATMVGKHDARTTGRSEEGG